MNEVPKQRWGCLQWGIVIGVVFLLGLMIRAGAMFICEMGMQSRAISNCKMVILSLKQFSKDNRSMYPDAEAIGAVSHSANQVFRRLFQAGIVTDEQIFGCPGSPFVPDGNIGTAPTFESAVASGECHWMLLKHQTDTSPGDTPLIIENAVKTQWPPKWNMSARAVNKRSRIWFFSEIVVGRNDGSIFVEKLRHDGTLDWHSPSNLDEHGKSWIDSLTPEQIAKLAYWDIEEK